MRCLVAFAVTFGLVAQDPRFEVQSRLVLVPVSVTDAKGRTVDGLEAEDFVVLDEGRPRKVRVDTMATGVAPIALVVAIQASGISRAVLEKVRKIGAMIQPLVTGERGCGGVVTFSDRVEWLQDCTSNGEKLASAFERVRAGAEKGARMLDAVDEAVGRLRKHTNSRRVLLLISETRDRGSEGSLSHAVLAAQSAGVTVYAATYSVYTTAFTGRAGAEPRMKRRPDRPSEETGTITGGAAQCGPSGCPVPQLPPPEQRFDILGGFGELVRLGRVKDTQALVEMTGGAVFLFTRLKGLERAIEKLGAELHSQYLLSFTPEESTAGYRRLEVRVAGGPYRVRARPGYWAGQLPALRTDDR